MEQETVMVVYKGSSLTRYSIELNIEAFPIPTDVKGKFNHYLLPVNMEEEISSGYQGFLDALIKDKIVRRIIETIDKVPCLQLIRVETALLDSIEETENGMRFWFVI